MTATTNALYRVLVVDDDNAVRATYHRILEPPPSDVGSLEALIEGTPAAHATPIFTVTDAAQGETAVRLHQAATNDGQPFQVAFIDMRMPPGWDGLRTAVALRAQDPAIYIVIATAFSDYNVNELQQALGHDVVLLRKPFNHEEVFQLARTLGQSWEARHRLETVTAELESRVFARTAELAGRMAQQQALAEIATRCVELGEADDAADAIHWSLARLGRITGADHAALFRWDEQLQAARMLQEWTALGITCLRPALGEVPRAAMMPAMVRFQQGKSFRFAHLADFAATVSTLRTGADAVIDAGLAMPVELGGQLAGLVSIGFAQGNPDCGADADPLLRAAGHLIFRALEAHDQARALRNSQEILEATQHAAHIGNWHIEADTLRFTGDSEVRRIHGLGTADEFGPGALAELIHPDDRPIADAALAAALARGRPYSMEYRIRRPDGTERWVYAWARPQLDAAGRTQALVGMLQDITARKQATQSLVNAERRWREILVNLPQIGVSLDPQGRIVFANAHLMRICGWQEHEVLGQDWFALFIPEERRDTVRAVFLEVMGSADVLGYSTFENEILTRDGERRNIAWTNVLTKDSGGKVHDVTCLGIDLTERQQAERALRRSEALLEATQHLSRVGGWEWDVERQRIHWTRETFRIHDVDPATVANGSLELIERSLACYREADRPTIIDAFQRCATSGEAYDLEFPFTTARGRNLWIRTTATAERDGARIVRVLGTIIDITAQHQAEQAARRNDARFRALLDQVPTVAVRGYTADGTVHYWNRASEQFFGYSRAEALGRNLFELIVPPPQRDAARQAAREMAASGRGQPVQERTLMHKDGSEVPVYSSDAAISADGFETELYALDVSLLEHRHIEANQRATQRSLEALLGNLPGMAYRCLGDRARTLVYVSAGVRELTGYTREDLATTPEAASLAHLVHPDDRERVAAAVAQALADASRFAIAYRILHADGSVRHVLEQGRRTSPLETIPPVIEGFIADCHDILAACNRPDSGPA